MYSFRRLIQTAVAVVCICVWVTLQTGEAHGDTGHNGLINPFSSNRSTVGVCCKYGGLFSSWFSSCCRKIKDITGVCTRLCHAEPVLYRGRLSNTTMTATLPYTSFLVAEYTLTTHDNEIILRIDIKLGVYNEKNGNRSLLDFLTCLKSSSSLSSQCIHNLVITLQEGTSINYSASHNLTSSQTTTTTSAHSSTPTPGGTATSPHTSTTTTSLNSSTSQRLISTSPTTSLRNVKTSQPLGLKTSTYTTQSRYTETLTTHTGLTLTSSTTSVYAITSTSQARTSTMSTMSSRSKDTSTSQASVPTTLTTSSELTSMSKSSVLTATKSPSSSSTSSVYTSYTNTESEIIPSAEAAARHSPSTRILIGVVVGGVLAGIVLASVIIVLWCILRNKRKPATRTEDSIYNDNTPQKTIPRPVDNPVYNLHSEDLAITWCNPELQVTPTETDTYTEVLGRGNASRPTSDVTSVVNDDDQIYASLRQMATPRLFSFTPRSSTSTTYDTLDHVTRKDLTPLAVRHAYSRLRDEFSQCSDNESRRSGEYDRLKLK
ncbi:mucin-5AC-like [Gigantopelta aegis]|uniref:mucin-5AC-like n=1 Tax=Gigantopelta aegis TaxID=1735272 RepID=UPI001B889190|nr:mucin-5AC-like [Gigantopelta aegis]